MNGKIPLVPINRDANRFLSRGKAIATLQGALAICSDKLHTFAAACDAARALNEGDSQVEWNIKATKSPTGEFTVKMSYRRTRSVEPLVLMKHLEQNFNL